MHTGSLRIDKEKMSKSLKNFITIKDALKHNTSEVLRFFLISSHYRSPLNYSEEGLSESKTSLDRLYNALKDLTLDEKLVSKSNYFKKFHDVMKDDFNTPAGISVLFEMAREINSLKKDHKEEEANALGSELKVLSKSLGILQQNPDDFFKAGASLSEEEIDNLIKKRNEARLNRDFKLADEIRDDLLSKGIVLEDKESGTVWKKD